MAKRNHSERVSYTYMNHYFNRIRGHEITKLSKSIIAKLFIMSGGFGKSIMKQTLGIYMNEIMITNKG